MKMSSFLFGMVSASITFLVIAIIIINTNPSRSAKTVGKVEAQTTVDTNPTSTILRVMGSTKFGKGYHGHHTTHICLGGIQYYVITLEGFHNDRMKVFPRVNLEGQMMSCKVSWTESEI